MNLERNGGIGDDEEVVIFTLLLFVKVHIKKGLLNKFSVCHNYKHVEVLRK